MSNGFQKSLELYSRAGRIPGRSNTRSKAPGKFAAIGSGPLYGSMGSGGEMFDADSNCYIDMLCGLGAISLGYGREIGREYMRGVYSLPHQAEVEVSEIIQKDVAPWARYVKTTRTGTEALAGAVWTARLATRRRPVFVAEGAYHGWLPWAADRGVMGTDGEWTHEYRYGWCGEIARLVQEHGLPAAIVVEPSRWQETPTGYLSTLQADARRLGALFIVDEMIYGGRWALGGATEIHQLKPDLACYGKALGNGAPVAFIVGGDHLAEFGARVSGTYSGDVGCFDAVGRVLSVYRHEPVIETLWKRGRQLWRGMKEAIDVVGAAACVHLEGVAPVHGRIRFDNSSIQPIFSAKMSERGVLFSPDCWNVCFAHTTDQIEAVIDAVAASLKSMKEEGCLGKDA